MVRGPLLAQQRDMPGLCVWAVRVAGPGALLLVQLGTETSRGQPERARTVVATINVCLVWSSSSRSGYNVLVSARGHASGGLWLHRSGKQAVDAVMSVNS